MRIRDLIRFGIFLGVACLHFWFEWYGWKVHLREIPPPADLGDRLWQVLSFPLFTVVRRRTQHLHFYELMLLNSALWGVAVTALVSMALRPRSRRRRRGTLALPRGTTAVAGPAVQNVENASKGRVGLERPSPPRSPRQSHPSEDQGRSDGHEGAMSEPPKEPVRHGEKPRT